MFEFDTDAEFVQGLRDADEQVWEQFYKAFLHPLLVSSGFRHHERTTVFGMFTLDNQEE